MTEAIIGLHGLIATAVVAYFVIAGVWGIVEFARGARNLSGTYASILVLAEVLALVQILAGFYALFAGRQPRDLLHILYGMLAVLLLPVVWSIFSRDRRIPLYMGIACFVITAAALRAYVTGR
jgi:cytochrome bd-type quinol oxidase subunit 1